MRRTGVGGWAFPDPIANARSTRAQGDRGLEVAHEEHDVADRVYDRIKPRPSSPGPRAAPAREGEIGAPCTPTVTLVEDAETIRMMGFPVIEALPSPGAADARLEGSNTAGCGDRHRFV